MEEFVRQFNNMLQESEYANFPIDVLEEEKGYKVIADLSGYSKENINISYEDDSLVITAKRMEGNKDTKYVLRERNLGNKRRSIYLPDINPESISAKFDQGLLVITMNNNEPNVKTIAIE